MGVSSNTHASSISATTTPEAITQIKKQITRQILEQKNGMVETQKATRTDLRVWSHSKKDWKDQSKPKNNQTRKLSVD